MDLVAMVGSACVKRATGHPSKPPAVVGQAQPARTEHFEQKRTNRERAPETELTFSWFDATASALFSACVSEITTPCSSSLSLRTPERDAPPSALLSGVFGSGLPVMVVKSPVGRGVVVNPVCGAPRCGVDPLDPYIPDIGPPPERKMDHPDCPRG